MVCSSQNFMFDIRFPFLCLYFSHHFVNDSGQNVTKGVVSYSNVSLIQIYRFIGNYKSKRCWICFESHFQNSNSNYYGLAHAFSCLLCKFFIWQWFFYFYSIITKNSNQFEKSSTVFKYFIYFLEMGMPCTLPIFISTYLWTLSQRLTSCSCISMWVFHTR